MKVSPADIVDRLSILFLKTYRLPYHRDTHGEWHAYSEAFGEMNIDGEYLNRLLDVNGRIWDLESDIRSGREGNLGLEEVGRRALLIRDLNAERIAIKNEIAARYGGFEEKKGQHASERPEQAAA